MELTHASGLGDLEALDHLPAPAWIFEGQRCCYANPAWYAFTGAGPGAADDDGWLRFVHPEDDRQQGAWRLRAADGSWDWVEETDAMWRGRRLSLLREAGAARRAEQQRSLEGLARAEEQRRLFLRSASHELRTPVSVVLLQLELALRTPLPEASRRHVEIALRNVERMQSLVADLVQVSHQEGPAGDVDAREVDLHAILQDAVASMEVASQVKGIEVTAEGVPLRVWADSNRMAQVAVNLLSNAIKFTPRGGKVRVTSAAEDKQAVFRVLDTGPGIPIERRGCLFRPFSQAHDARVDSGSGLGLYLCKRIVEAHGGGISLEDSPTGACFKVTLPCR